MKMVCILFFIEYTCSAFVVFKMYQCSLPWYNWNIVDSGVKHHNLNVLMVEYTYCTFKIR